MTFFTAGDVLRWTSLTAPDEPETIDADGTIHDALSLMFRHEFSQLPVVRDDRVAGVVTFESIAKLVKSVPEIDVRDTSVKGALVTPRFVDRDQNLFGLFETFATDEYVLIGSERELIGILTRYDVFYFLKDQFEPFVQIGEIERSLRDLFERSVSDLDERIAETFAPRAERDQSYSPPESIDHFNFEEYKRFVATNAEHLPSPIADDREFVLELLEQVRRHRNALFHFRADADEIDRETIDVAHGYFTGLVD